MKSYSQGILEYRVNWSAGELNDWIEYYDWRGQMSNRVHYIDGKHYGPSEDFFPQGNLSYRDF